MSQIHQLGNGLRVVLERMPHLRSAAIGVWIRAGSALETEQENGLSHLMEHMAFKGSSTRNAPQLADEMDAIGGHMNAATSKIYTAYYAKVREVDLPKAIELLADIVLNPLLDEKELEKEKNVVLEEIAMGEDAPEDVCYELINGAVYHADPLAMPIIGHKAGVQGFQQEDLIAYRKKHYQPVNAVISVAGRFDTQELLSVLEERFGAWTGQQANGYNEEKVAWISDRRVADKKTEQVQIAIAYPGLPIGHADQYTMQVFNTLFGGGMSSRLFQRIREEAGLVYSIFSAPTAYPNAGDFSIFAAATPKATKKVLSGIHAETERVGREGINPRELELAKAQLTTGYALSQESAYARMNANALGLLTKGKIKRPSTILRGIEAVTEEKVKHLARKIFHNEPCLALVGRKPERYLG